MENNYATVLPVSVPVPLPAIAWIPARPYVSFLRPVFSDRQAVFRVLLLLAGIRYLLCYGAQLPVYGSARSVRYAAPAVCVAVPVPFLLLFDAIAFHVVKTP